MHAGTSAGRNDGFRRRRLRGLLRLRPPSSIHPETIRSSRRNVPMSETIVIEKPAENYRTKILRKCGESVEMKQKFFSQYAAQIEAMAKDMAERFQSGKKLLVMGNGGSLCDALHFCV